jgi:multiple sugar transport system permease protein
LRRTADDLDGFEAESFDTVVINSVVQYFPDVNYLWAVLQAAVRMVTPGGTIFVGDVRSLPMLTTSIVWFGENADRALWAVIVSIVWKVLGFGMLLYVAAIQAIPGEINEATMVDGASYWQRVRKIVLPLSYRTFLLATLISVIGSLLAFDQFYIMTAGQPGNLTATSVFFIYLNSFPYLKLGYGAALSLILAALVLTCTILQMLLSRRLSS